MNKDETYNKLINGSLTFAANDDRLELVEFDGHVGVRIKGFQSVFLSGAYYKEKMPPLRGVILEQDKYGNWIETER